MLKPLDFVRIRPEYFEDNREIALISMPFSYLSKTPEEMEQERRERKEKENNTRNNIGLVTETNGVSAHVEWLIKGTTLKNAWWDLSDLEVVNNLAVLVSDRMAHPFGGNTEQGEKAYGKETTQNR